MNSILIKNILVNNCIQDILIEGDKISKISKDINFAASRVIDGQKMAAIPGFVNMHTHAAMTLMRGIGEDMSLMDWIYNKIWPVEKRLDDELVYWGTKLACLEMIKSGTVCFNDQYWNLSAAVEAVSEMGLRSVQPYVVLDLMDESRHDDIKKGCEKALEESAKWGEMNKFAIGVHAPYSVSEKMIRWSSDFARKNGLFLHIHLSETEVENADSVKLHGVSPTKYLQKLGVLGPEVIAAHCLWLDDDDIKILADKGVKAVHNINSNLKLASGYMFRYNEMRDAGVTVTLGTDGCASSNNLDMIEVMKTTALMQKAWRKDPTAMPLDELFTLATENGGKALGLKTGKLQEGYYADLSLIKLNTVAFTPNIDFLANLVYSAHGDCIDTLICNGQILMENRICAQENDILENVNRLYKKLL
jgi:5-methylthioadenosine/S-adenosylhomocysteine deaminase